jgi:hypothetical protein
MHLLGTDAYRFALATSLANAQGTLSVVSAFVTAPGIEWILDRLNTSVGSFRVMARWHLEDFLLGASDIEAYEHVQRRGGRFFVLPNLHAKLILVDNEQLFVGSANVTALGLKLVPGANREMGVKLDASKADIATVEVMFAEAIEVTPTLCNEFRARIETLKLPANWPTDLHWPTGLAKRLASSPQRLWVAELFWSTSPQILLDAVSSREVNEIVVHDVALLGLDSDLQVERTTLRERFLESRPWTWLVARLLEEESHELSFGRLSKLLHDALIDDPKPYRKDVKQLIANLLSWVEEFGETTAVIERMRYSQRVLLIRH